MSEISRGVSRTMSGLGYLRHCPGYTPSPCLANFSSSDIVQLRHCEM